MKSPAGDSVPLPAARRSLFTFEERTDRCVRTRTAPNGAEQRHGRDADREPTSVGHAASEDEPTRTVPANRGGGAIVVKTEWRTGPRTRAWDELWRWLLSEVRPDAPTDGDAEPDTD